MTVDHEHECRKCGDGIECDIPNDECNDIPNNGLCLGCSRAEEWYYDHLAATFDGMARPIRGAS